MLSLGSTVLPLIKTFAGHINSKKPHRSPVEIHKSNRNPEKNPYKSIEMQFSSSFSKPCHEACAAMGAPRIAHPATPSRTQPLPDLSSPGGNMTRFNGFQMMGNLTDLTVENGDLMWFKYLTLGQKTIQHVDLYNRLEWWFNHLKWWLNDLKFGLNHQNGI